jgi:colicin import membrane protein
MKEETWFKMLTISIILHFLVVGAFSIPIKKTPKRFDTLSSYSVNLVGDIGGNSGGIKAGKYLESESVQKKETSHAKVNKPVSTPKTKPVPTRKEKEAVSISKKKVPPKAKPSNETTTKEELSHLNDRIREMKKKTEYIDVTRSKGLSGNTGPGRTGNGGYGLPGSSEGGGRTLDPVSQRYMLEIWEKIKNSWGLPGIASFKKDLETIVTIRIRKDGRIVDINIEKRSGNRIYDESILRVLRSVDPLPPIPTTLNMETMEIGFRFLPGDLS